MVGRFHTYKRCTQSSGMYFVSHHNAKNLSSINKKEPRLCAMKLWSVTLRSTRWSVVETLSYAWYDQPSNSFPLDLGFPLRMACAS